MKKFKKTLTVISTIAALTISALPVTALYEDTIDPVSSDYANTGNYYNEYSYVDDTENIAWKDSWITVYKNGNMYSCLTKYTLVTFVPAEGQELPELPDGYSVRTPDCIYDKENPDRKGISVNNQKELDEVTAIVKGWAQKGIVKLPKIYRYYSYGCGDAGGVSIDVTLKNADDYSEFTADYPEYRASRSSYNPEIANLSLSKEQRVNAPEIKKTIESDSRVKNAEMLCISCCVLHTLLDEPEPIYCDEPEIPAENGPVVTNAATSRPVVYTTEVCYPTIPVSSSSVFTTEVRYATIPVSSSSVFTTEVCYPTTPVSKPDVIKGDISGNGKIDLYDAIEIAEFLVTRKAFTEEEMDIADFNGDGKIDIYDAIGIAEHIIKNK